MTRGETSTRTARATGYTETRRSRGEVRAYATHRARARPRGAGRARSVVSGPSSGPRRARALRATPLPRHLRSLPGVLLHLKRSVSTHGITEQNMHSSAAEQSSEVQRA